MSDNPIPETETSDDILKFELIIGDAGGQIDNGDVPVRWCASPDFIKELEAKGVKDPHVLITSYHNGGREGWAYDNEMDRKLIPLSELMTYVRFTKAGKCKIYGMVLDGAAGRQSLHDKYMRKYYGEYHNIISTYNDDLHNDLDYVVVATSNFVEIPENVFGKEPSPWIKWYVNLWHSRDRVADECEFRKRFLIAFIFKWIPFLPFITGWITFRVFYAGSACLAGYFKKVRFLRAFRPYKYPSMEYNVFDDLCRPILDNFFIFTRPEISSSKGTISYMYIGLALVPALHLIVASIVLLFLNPDGVVGLVAITAGIIAVIAGILLVLDITIIGIETMLHFKVGEALINSINKMVLRILDWLPKVDPHSQNAKIAFLSFMGLLAAIIMGVGLKFLIAAIGIFIVSILATFVFFFFLLLFSDKLLYLMDRYFAMSAKANDYGHITELLCAKEEDNLRPNYKYIPKKQRTVRLWARDLKNKVCKPMQS